MIYLKVMPKDLEEGSGVLEELEGLEEVLEGLEVDHTEQCLDVQELHYIPDHPIMVAGKV